MKTFRSWVCVIAVAAFSSCLVFAEDKKPGAAAPDAKKDSGKPGEGTPPGMSAEQMAEMEAWAKAATPGPEHKQLEAMVGTFEVACKSWMNPDPKAPPMESKGTSTTEMIMGGRWVRTVFNGEFMGMPFEGRGIIGYDNIDKKYKSVWIDTMCTTVQVDNGTYDAATKTFAFSGEFKDPTGKTVKARWTDQVIGSDKLVMTHYHTEQGKPEAKVMELTFTRAKAPSKP